MDKKTMIEIKCTEEEKNLIIFAIGVASGLLSDEGEASSYSEKFHKIFKSIKWETGGQDANLRTRQGKDN